LAILISTKTGVSSAFESRDVNDPIIKHVYVQTLSELSCKTKYPSKEYICTFHKRETYFL